MLRIGNAIINIPAGVQVDVNNNIMTVKGPKGTLSQAYDPIITPVIEGSVLKFTRANDQGPTKAKHGLYRALIANMVEGVTKGYSKTLVINGVGYKCAIQGTKLVLNIGFSHPINFDIPADVKITCTSATEVKVEGCDKTRVGQVAADIKALKPIEPYHGYGIKYSDQFVLRKEIKKAAKKK